MRLIRFEDEQGRVRFGCDPNEGFTRATLLDGSPLDGGRPTGEAARIGRLLCPIEPRAILCIGLNYRDHARETGAELPKFPVLFMKNPASAHHPGAAVRLPACSAGPETDYEVELAAVIGKPTRDVDEAEALDCVLGYTVGNDVSARRWQKSGGGGQWIRGKSFDTFCPFGPTLVTPDELGDPQNLALSTTVNGQTLQQSNTSEMIFTVAQLIAFLSQDTTLLPGTLLMTGTPAGVGVARDPKRFLEAGDTVTCAIERIGELTNPIVNPGGEA
jgi:2-keto-4-pentenoate hydratase/2-oxohepta-3-ene-1,7-dioic acid hydratase in catechol pathway